MSSSTPRFSKEWYEQRPTVAVVPLIERYGETYVIFQVSRHKKFGSLKIDPFRGTVEKGESDWDTGRRELKEESCCVFVMDKVEDPPFHIEYVHVGSNVFPVRFEFDKEIGIDQILDQYDENFGHMTNPYYQETRGIAIFPLHDLETHDVMPGTEIRVSSQSSYILSYLCQFTKSPQNPGYFSVPTYRVHLEPGQKSGVSSFCAEEKCIDVSPLLPGPKRHLASMYYYSAGSSVVSASSSSH